MEGEVDREMAPVHLEIEGESDDVRLLYEAIDDNNWPVAKDFIEHRSREPIPVQLAFCARRREMGRYLYSFTRLHLFRDNHSLGSSFLGTCLATGELDIALHLLRQCNELLFAVDKNISTIERIACHLPDSLDKSQLPFWKQWFYDYIKTPSTRIIQHIDDTDAENFRPDQGPSLLHRLISSINNLSGMTEILEMKQQHAQAVEILDLVCQNVSVLSVEQRDMTAAALRAAGRAGKAEFLVRVTKANPEFVSLLSLSLSDVFFDAVKNRRVEIFNLLRGFSLKHVVLSMKEEGNFNKLVFSAAALAPSSYLNNICGAALQMQRELEWFKEAESMVRMVDPGSMIFVKDGRNLHGIFKQNHIDLRNSGEKWMKETATSCSVVGTLIIAIMFAVAFTVPGGNDQTSGYPIFLKNKLFIVFLMSDILSLFFATTSVLTFLGIITSSGYAEEDFLASLPRKLSIGFSSLSISIAAMAVAFLFTMIIMLQRNASRLWAFLLICILGGILVTHFVLFQFPHLVAVMCSCFRPSIFKNVEKWA